MDDCRDTVEIISTLLCVLGHECCGASTGAEAIERCESFEPEIVLLDLELPDISGLKVAHQLRCRSKRSFFIAALTGRGMREDRARTLEAGFDAHLLKPVDRGVLCEVVATASHLHKG